MDPVTAIAALSVLLVIIGAIVRNAITVAATKATADAAIRRVEKLTDDFNESRVASATTFATNASLKLVEDRVMAAIGSIGVYLGNLTERIDKVLQEKPTHDRE